MGDSLNPIGQIPVNYERYLRGSLFIEPFGEISTASKRCYVNGESRLPKKAAEYTNIIGVRISTLIRPTRIS